ncbi:serine protease SPPA, chloroplastic-like isoform X3 [Durio zibethinus]|uniref:Serine protease SPPA, chloroplastic-like isoform X3 n=1 Tax=Durio zibethinus TaxID=66656 RepID=A0A6P5YB64_DURZI|nr:serine protease SPPA, chloroplastic-like isoform X3 [Durio zibethinus]
MSKLLLFHTAHSTPKIHQRSFTTILSRPLSIPSHSKCRSPVSLFPSISSSTLHPHLQRQSFSFSYSFSTPAFDDSSSSTEAQKEKEEKVGSRSGEKSETEEYPSGEVEYEKMSGWKSFVVKFKMLIAFPWERVRKGSVLTMKLRGQISDQLKSRFSSGLSLPQICENFVKAAYDPRISGVYLHIEPLNCGWGKVEEIRRHILNFKKSGKFIIAYIPACGEKEFYLACACEEIYAPSSAYFSLYGLTVQASFLGGVFEKIGIEPQVQRIGKYKSAGDQLTRKTMSEENCEMLTKLLDNIYGNWLDVVSSSKGKKREDVENFINEGVYKVEKLKEEGFITNIHYDDEVISKLKERLGVQKDKKLHMVDYRKYSKVRKWTLGLAGGRDQIAVIRASGSISRVQSPLSTPSSGIIAEQIIEKIRSVRGKFNLGNLYEKIGFNKEVISRGRYAELFAAEQRPLSLDEAELFAKSAQNAYKQFRDKAALSRSMPVEMMEEVAQGRVWAGKDAASRGLIDAIGGLSRAIAIAKHKTNIPQDRQVTLVELSRPSPTLPEILSGIGSSIVGVDRTLKELVQDLTFSDGVQARMDGIVFQRLEGFSNATPLFSLIKDYLSSL